MSSARRGGGVSNKNSRAKSTVKSQSSANSGSRHLDKKKKKKKGHNSVQKKHGVKCIIGAKAPNKAKRSFENAADVTADLMGEMMASRSKGKKRPRQVDDAFTHSSKLVKTSDVVGAATSTFAAPQFVYKSEVQAPSAVTPDGLSAQLLNSLEEAHCDRVKELEEVRSAKYMSRFQESSKKVGENPFTALDAEDDEKVSPVVSAGYFAPSTLFLPSEHVSRPVFGRVIEKEKVVEVRPVEKPASTTEAGFAKPTFTF
mmetsp:Transcript_10008/g.16397  ORF Transcript_10008/g.16397 Transcript_10008/m.16397 type:complete len:257 (+) Transcript_10008:452-1222(+)